MRIGVDVFAKDVEAIYVSTTIGGNIPIKKRIRPLEERQ